MSVRDRETMQLPPRRGPSILDKTFRYVRSDKTDLRATFARIRKRNAAQQGNGPPEATYSETRDRQPAVSAPIPMRRKA